VTLTSVGHISTLWNLTFNEQHLRCVVYRSVNGMELRLESPAGVILVEPFDMEPRALARTKALRESLKRRGWQEEIPSPESQTPSPKA
jgi:hypothetical protein